MDFIGGTALNRGHEFGYWGDFNRTKNALASIPGVTLTRKWHNLDLTLEEFGFEVTTNGLFENTETKMKRATSQEAAPVSKG